MEHETTQYHNAFDSLDQWYTEGEGVQAFAGCLDMNTSGGCTVWFVHELTVPFTITYEAMAVAGEGSNDHCSDINCFWLASDPAREGTGMLGARKGHFLEYDDLHLYYVGFGGHRNTMTRFRRYPKITDEV